MNNKKYITTDINRIKSLITEKSSMVQLKSTNYPCVKFDKDGTQNDYVNDALLQDLQKACQATGVEITITTAKTGHPSNRTGKPSRHQSGTGVDIAMLDGQRPMGATNATNGNASFREKGHKVAKALESLGYRRNVERGNVKSVLWHTNLGGNHYNHLHVSNTGGASTSSASVPSSSSSSSSSSSRQSSGKSSSPKGFGDVLYKTFFGSLFGEGREEYLNQINEVFAKPVMTSQNVDLDKKEVSFAIYPNQPVFSPEDGKVINIQDLTSTGSKIVIIKSKYESENFEIKISGVRPTVSVGEKVMKGDVIGYTLGYYVGMEVLDRYGKKVSVANFYTEKDLNSNSDKNKNKVGDTTPVFDKETDAKPFSFHPTDIVTVPIKLASNVFSGVLDNIKTQNRRALEKAKQKKSEQSEEKIKDDIKKIKKIINKKPSL
jgi:hypothetical protein